MVGVEMATEPRNQNLTETHRQVLNVLARAPHGRDVNALLSLGFKLETMADLVQSGLATVLSGLRSTNAPKRPALDSLCGAAQTEASRSPGRTLPVSGMPL